MRFADQRKANAKIARDLVCHVAPILLELESRLKRAAEQQPSNSHSAIQAYAKLIDTRRAHGAHADRCTVCKRVNKQVQALSRAEFSRLADDIGNLFEGEQMRLARAECAAKYERPQDVDLEAEGF